MANEFRQIRASVEWAKEVLALEAALKTYDNADAERAKMAAAQKQHEDIIADLKKQQADIRAENDKIKAASDLEVENYKTENESKKRQLASQLTPAQNTLGQVEQRIAAARLELSQVTTEVKQAKAEREQEAKYLEQLRQSIAALQAQHGIRA